MKLPSLASENASQLRQIVDTTRCNLEALKAMKQNTDSRDMIIIYTLVQKLDNKTKKEWELRISNKELPTLQLTFLEHRCNALESVSTKTKTNEQRQASVKKMSQSYVSVKPLCEVCKDSHTLSQCGTFKWLSNDEKYKIVRNHKLCINYLSNKHMIKEYQSHVCKICGKWHHTLIDRNKDLSREHSNGGQGLSQQQENLQATYYTFKKSAVSCVLLATAQIKVKNCKGNLHTCRAFLDCGSQYNFITESSVRRLGLKQTRNLVRITGIKDATSVANYNVNLEITSMKNDYTSKLNCLVLPRITSKMPRTDIDISTWKFPSDVVLADRDFSKPAPIDILLGAEIFFEVLMTERYVCKGLPVLQNTKLGYILSGKLHHSYVKDYKRQCYSLLIQMDSLHHIMEWFWSIEEMTNKILTKEEKACERHFELNTRR